jgi:3-deoxy-D-manno-octulosonic-acid transferase
MKRFLYILATYALAPLYCAVLWWKGWRERGYWQHFGERFGYAPHQPQPLIWLHAVSVGEVQAASSLLRALRAEYPDAPLLVTTTTAAGRARLQSLSVEQVTVAYLPLDLPGCVRRFLRRSQPRVAIIFETEIWPTLYHECGRQRIPLVLASARISPKTLGRYRRIAGLLRPLFARDVVIAAQGTADAQRFEALGANPARTHVMGNLKFELNLPEDLPARAALLHQKYLKQRPLWVAGSTHADEEHGVLRAHRALQAVVPDALLVMAPRHPPRFAEAAGTLLELQMSFIRRSQDIQTAQPYDVILLDTLGELLEWYACADVAYVGGSLVPVGGHNLLEPAALGVPVLAGPHQLNNVEVVRLLQSAGALQIVHNEAELAAALQALFANPEERQRRGQLGRQCLHDNRGALEKLLGLIRPLLER